MLYLSFDLFSEPSSHLILGKKSETRMRSKTRSKHIKYSKGTLIYYVLTVCLCHNK